MKQSEFLNLETAAKQPAIHFVRVEFDGGTPCNIPRLGYGEGYGSFQVKPFGHVVRLKFGRPMSANAAEVWTLVSALDHVLKCYFPQRTCVHISGDSKIALARCFKHPKKKRKKQDSSEFENACAELLQRCLLFHTVETHWRGRARSVEIFGH